MNSILNKTIVFLILLLTVNIFAQSPRNTWKTTEWPDGIKEVVSMSIGLKNYVVLLKPTAGEAWINEVSEDGNMVRTAWHTNNWEKGIECAATYEAGGNHYLFIVNSTNGHAWINKLNNNATKGTWTWKTTKWVKGIREAEIVKVGNKNVLIISQPKPGNIWHFELTDDGKVGEAIENLVKVKNVRAITSYHAGNKTYAVYIGTDGGARIHELTTEGKMGSKTWSINNYERGIATATTISFAGTNSILISNPINGHAWIIELTDDGKTGKFLWNTQHWQKGIMGLDTYYANGIPFVMITNPKNSTAWIFNNVGHFPEKLVNVDAETNKIYAELLASEKKMSNTANSVKNDAINSLEAAQSVEKSVSSIKSKLDNYYASLDAFRKIPIIGTAAAGLGMTINTTNSKVGKVQSSAMNLNRTGIKPTFNNANTTYQTTNMADAAVLGMIGKLAVLAESNDGTSIAKTFISKISPELKTLNSESGKITKITKSIAKIKKPVNTFNKGIDKFNSKVKKVDKVVKKVNSVLDKKFKKKILTKKISISIRDILTGGKVGKVFRKFAKKFANKAMKPLVKKFKIKLPGVPSLDEIKSEISKAKVKGAEMVDISKKIRKSAENINKINVSF